MSRLWLVPVTRDEALGWIRATHRTHAGRPPGYRFAVGVADEAGLHGVALAGHPVSRELAKDPMAFEITRVSTDGTPNACSMLYGACWRAARALGYRRGITYTQEGESGASLRAAGWFLVATIPPRAAHRGWDAPGRPRVNNGLNGVVRYRWEVRA